MDEVILNIKLKEGAENKKTKACCDYEIEINGLNLGRGVKGFTLDMTNPSDRPKVFMEIIPDLINLEEVSSELLTELT